MKGAFIAAWLVGEGIVIWRQVHVHHHLPVPGDLLAITALFAGLGAVAEFPKATTLVTALAWGIDIAGVMNVLPAGLTGQIQGAEATSARAEGLAGAAPVTAT